MFICYRKCHTIYKTSYKIKIQHACLVHKHIYTHIYTYIYAYYLYTTCIYITYYMIHIHIHAYITYTYAYFYV